MNKESAIFESKCEEQFMGFIKQFGYRQREKNCYNEGSQNEFVRISFFNKLLKKEIICDFYGDQSITTKNEICVIIQQEDSFGNITSFDLPSFLAFINMNRPVRHEDKLQYRFKLNPLDFELSISKSLNEITSKLATELFELITTNASVKIPIHDPRDNY